MEKTTLPMDEKWKKHSEISYILIHIFSHYHHKHDNQVHSEISTHIHVLQSEPICTDLHQSESNSRSHFDLTKTLALYHRNFM